MKRTEKLMLIVLSSFAVITGCSDDNFIKTTPAIPGAEIVFGASASFENGNAQTRTIYGDKGDGYQIINWEPNDHIRIVSAQAAQDKEADYKLTTITPGNTAGDKESSATTLTKVSNGLQWGSGEHTFYAVYPSPYIFGTTPGEDQTQTTITNNTVTGVLPVVQTIKEKRENVTVGSNTYKYMLMPNMDNAFMVAKAVYNTATNGGEGVELHFKPIVTAIEIEIKAGSINPNTSDESLTLTSVSLRSTSGQDICGKFSANITNLNMDNNVTSGLTVSNGNPFVGEHNRVTIELNSQNIVLTEDESCILTFFVLPTAEFNDNNTDLKLDVLYTTGGVSTIKTCTLGKEIRAHKKYFFSNLTLPNITPSTNSSNWFSTLDDDIYLSQLSIPGAGNAASGNYSGGNPQFYKEQTLSLEQQWNLGVRCFELISDKQKTSSGNLLSKNLTCNQTSVGITYGQALTTLTNLLKANPNECLIVISSYQPGDGDSSGERDCQNYMDNLSNSFSTPSYNGVDIVKWETNSTIADLRGKLVIISRISQEGEDLLELTNIPTWLTYIKGWGSLKDKWNRRFGDAYYPGYNQQIGITGSRLNIEDYLWQETQETRSKNWIWEEYTYTEVITATANYSGYPVSTPNFLYNTNGGGQAWVQEWMRVSPEHNEYIRIKENGWSSNKRYCLYIKWPNSYEEKYTNITYTFERAKSIQDVLYINSLCGYYISFDNSNSRSPYAPNVNFNGHTYKGGDLGSGGMGGDFQTYNVAMNNRVYDYVLEQSNANTTGPMGIVMMDYIGTGNGGTNLPTLILQNNFKFPLKKDGNETTKSYNASYEQGGDAIGWK